MQKMYRPFRVGLVFIIVAVLLSVFVTELYRMQIYEIQPSEDELYPQKTVFRTETLNAARGNIYDRNGILLASGRPTYNIMLSWHALNNFPDSRNNIIRELVFTAMDEGVRYNDTFPITLGAPFTYISNMTSQQRYRLDQYLAFHKIDPDISASDLLARLRDHYKIGFTTGITEARLIIGIRYELETRLIIHNIAPYAFANDVSTGFITLLEERGLIGVYVESNYIREYHTSNAANLLGFTGPIPVEKFDEYTEKGYPMNALIGREGAELAFEDLLRGVNGKQTIRTSDTGMVMELDTITEPEPGQHIYLTLDIDLQGATEDALRSHIISMNLEVEEEDKKITGGAVAVLDVRNGEVLAAATYPTFNLATLSQDWGTLLNDPNMPLLNRAMQGSYKPGSTFKMVTALAGLRDKIIERWTPINDVGLYDLYDTYQPACAVYHTYGVGHGEVDVVQAIERSCNYFFVTVADMVGGGGVQGEGGGVVGADYLAATAMEFGFGRSTGLEVPEIPGVLATPEWKRRELGEDWWRADTLMTAFGQGHNQFTPVQLANYAATIASGGKLHQLTLLRRVLSADMTEVTYSHEPTVINEIEEKEYIEIIQEGMLAVSRSEWYGTAYKVFGNYPIPVAAKTGTVESETAVIDNGVFVCYAPANAPEIAIAIVIEKGGSGSAVMDIARTIFDYYFSKEITAFTVPYGELIP